MARPVTLPCNKFPRQLTSAGGAKILWCARHRSSELFKATDIPSQCLRRLGSGNARRGWAATPASWRSHLAVVQNFPYRCIFALFSQTFPVPGLERSALASEVTCSAAIVLDGECHQYMHGHRLTTAWERLP